LAVITAPQHSPRAARRRLWSLTGHPPSLSFVAAATIRAHRATPVFCDISGPDDLNLDPADLEAAVTPEHEGRAPLHYGGYPCDVAAVRAFAEARAVVLGRGACPGARWHGGFAGRWGASGASASSRTEPPVGQGDMIVTDDDGSPRACACCVRTG
jgi:dTDP-4-amino-4,6-dideoxygalactose transaminase